MKLFIKFIKVFVLPPAIFLLADACFYLLWIATCSLPTGHFYFGCITNALVKGVTGFSL